MVKHKHFKFRLTKVEQKYGNWHLKTTWTKPFDFIFLKYLGSQSLVQSCFQETLKMNFREFFKENKSGHFMLRPRHLAQTGIRLVKSANNRNLVIFAHFDSKIHIFASEKHFQQKYVTICHKSADYIVSKPHLHI